MRGLTDGRVGKHSAEHRRAPPEGFNAFLIALARGRVPEGCPEPDVVVLDFAEDAARRDAPAGRFGEDLASVLTLLRLVGACHEAVEAGREAHALYVRYLASRAAR